MTRLRPKPWHHHRFRLLHSTLSLIFVFLFSAIFAASCEADLVTNGDFSSGTISDFENHLVFSEHDSGWGTKNAHWSINGSGAAERAITAAAGDAGLAQVNTVMMETGNQFELCLDWTADVDATTADDLNLNVYVVAWKEGTAPTGSGDTGNRFFTGLNFQSAQSRVVGTGGSWTDLSDGSVHGGNATADPFVISGTAGTTVGSSFTLNFGADSVEDFDHFGIKIQAPTGNSGGGGTIDNIVVKDLSVVPEPSSLLVMIGVFLAGVGCRRRKLLA